MASGDPILFRNLAEGFRSLAKEADRQSEVARLDGLARDCDDRAAALEPSYRDD